VVEVPFQVFAVDVAPSENPQKWVTYPEVTPLPTRAAEQTVQIRINAVQNALGGISWQLNETSNSPDPLFSFQEGATVHIELDNQIGPEHPFHLHGQFFQIDDPLQPGLKDTVLVPGVSKVNIVAYMDNPGRWMAHCHILEHAELGMMSEIVIEPSAQ
jgi:FtsP/CotA-like multicopper oxidase with cupredoxin domain